MGYSSGDNDVQVRGFDAFPLYIRGRKQQLYPTSSRIPLKYLLVYQLTSHVVLPPRLELVSYISWLLPTMTRMNV